MEESKKLRYCQEYEVLSSFLNAMIDDLSSVCTNKDEVLSSIGANPISKDNAIVLESEDEERIKCLISGIQDYTEAIYDKLVEICSEKTAGYLVSEAQTLSDAYLNAPVECDEKDTFVLVHPDVLLARRDRVLSEFDKLNNNEIEKECLLMYNAYSGELRKQNLVENNLYSFVGEDKLLSLVADASQKYMESFADGTPEFVTWSRDKVHDRKESFLDVLHKMTDEDKKAYYCEISDVWLNAVNSSMAFRSEIEKSVDPETVSKVYDLVDQSISESIFYKNATDEEIEASLDPEQKQTLDELFGDLL